MAGPLQFGYDTNWKPQGSLAGFLAGQRENELGLARLMQQYGAAQELESKKYENQITQSSVPAKQSEFLLQKLMSDQALNTPGYAPTMVGGTMAEAEGKVQTTKKTRLANEETERDVKESEALQTLDNVLNSMYANPDTPANMPMIMDALKRLGIPQEGIIQIIEAGKGKSPVEILRAVRDQYVDFKARTPKFMEKSLIQGQKDTAEMERVKVKMESAEEIAKIKAAVQNAIAASKGDKLNLDQFIARELAQIYKDPRERVYAAQLAQLYKGEVMKYANSGLIFNKDESGRTTVGQAETPTPSTFPQIPFQGIPGAGTPPSTQQQKPTLDPQKEQDIIKQQLGPNYNPKKFRYRINPDTGKIQSTPKG